MILTPTVAFARASPAGTDADVVHARLNSPERAKALEEAVRKAALAEKAASEVRNEGAL